MKKKSERDPKNKSSSKETPSMSPDDTVDPKIVKNVADTLKPHIENLIDVKINDSVKPIQTELRNMQTTFTEEFKNIMAEIKAPNTDDNSIVIPKGINQDDLSKGLKIDPVLNPQQPTQSPQPTQQGSMDMNKIMSEAMKDPNIANMLKSFGIGSQGGMQGIPSIPQTSMNNIPPDFANMSPQQLEWMKQQQSMQMLPVIMQFLGPMLQPQQGGPMMEMMMRKFMSDMSFNEHMNRGMLNWASKAIFKDPTLSAGYEDASMRYMSPIADPGMYSPPNYPTPTQNLGSQPGQTQQEQK